MLLLIGIDMYRCEFSNQGKEFISCEGFILVGFELSILIWSEFFGPWKRIWKSWSPEKCCFIM